MDQELKISNLPQRQLDENQAMRFLSKKVELPAGALIPEYYWPAHIREEFQAQKREKEALIEKVYKPYPSLEESIRTYQNRLDDQQSAIERYEALYERYQQGLLSEREVEQMKIWRRSILAKMGTGRSYDPWVERFYKRASEAYDRGEASGDFKEFFDVVAEYRKALEDQIRYYRWLLQPPPSPDFKVTTLEQQYFVEAHRRGIQALDVGYGPGIARAHLYQSLKEMMEVEGLNIRESTRNFLEISEVRERSRIIRVLNLDQQISDRIRAGENEKVKALNPAVAKAWLGLVRHGLYDSNGRQYNDTELMRLWGFHDEKEFRFARKHLFGAIREDLYFRYQFSGLSSDKFQNLPEDRKQRLLSRLQQDFERLWNDRRRIN